MSVRTDKKSRMTLQAPEGTDIDPREVKGSQGLKLKQEPVTGELHVKTV